MNDETTANIQKLVAELDSIIPKDGARIQFAQYGGGADESKITGTQQGYLRLGVEFLRGACTPTSGSDASRVPVDLEYLIAEDSDIGFDSFERVDHLPPPAHANGAHGGKNGLMLTGCIGAALFIAALVIIGLGTTLQWIFQF